MKSIKFIIVTLFMCITMMSFGQTDTINGWGMTEWGMTEVQIKTLYPEAIYLEKSEIYSNGIYVNLIIPSFEIGSDRFKVSFQMDSSSKSLTGVLLDYLGKTPSVSYKYLQSSLIEKYGVPTVKEDSDSDNRRSIWVFKQTRIEIQYLNISGIITYLKIHYTKPKKQNGL